MPVDDFIDRQLLLEATRHFHTGVALLTTIDFVGRPRLVNASVLIPTSIDPPIITTCLTVDTDSYPFAYCESFAVSILSADQAELARRLVTTTEDRFLYNDLHDGPEVKQPRVPTVVGASATLRCNVYDRLTVGDHTVLLGRVFDVNTSPVQPR